MDLTFFEYPGAIPGLAGAGMVHRIVWRVGSPASLDFWRERLAAPTSGAELKEDSLLFSDPEGLAHELIVSSSSDQPLRAISPEIPAEHALQGFEGVRAYSSRPAGSERCSPRRSASRAARASAGRCAATPQRLLRI